jgi:hypothetical protein
MGMKRCSWKNNDEASAGGLAGIFILFVVCSLFIGMLGGVVDRMQQTNDAMIQQANTPGSIPVSQDRIDTFNALTGAFAIMAFMILIAAGINYWINSIRESSGDV